MELLNIQVQKDSATTVSKEVTRDEAEAIASRLPVKVATPAGFVDWQEFVDAPKKALAAQEAATLASLLKRKDMKRADFMALDDETRDRMLVEESAAMASDADIAAGKAGDRVVVPGTNSGV